MKGTVKKAVWIIILTILSAIIFFYKSLFFGEDKTLQKKLQTLLHINPYTREYFQKQKINNLYTNLNSIDNYNKYCHANHKFCTIFPHQSRLADQIRLKSVQYAGQTNLQDDNIQNLAENLDIITSLQKYRNYPYIFSQLFLINKNDKTISQKAINLGKKGIKFLCDNTGTYAIGSGCINYQLPQNLAFNYYYYLQNAEQSSYYYTLASQSTGSPASLLKMPAIVMGRGGFHNKSALMRYEKFVNEKDKILQLEYLHKALTEYTLNIIKKSQESQTNKLINNNKISKSQCKNNLICLQKNNYIRQTIDKEINKCSTEQKTREDETICTILEYGIANNFIQIDGTLIYPIDNQMTYRRRSDIQDRRIILKSDIQ